MGSSISICNFYENEVKSFGRHKMTKKSSFEVAFSAINIYSHIKFQLKRGNINGLRGHVLIGKFPVSIKKIRKIA